MYSGHAQVLFMCVPSPRLAMLRDAKKVHVRSESDPDSYDVAGTLNSRRSSMYKDALLLAPFLYYLARRCMLYLLGFFVLALTLEHRY